MPSFRTHRVRSLLDARPGLARMVLDDDSRAYALTDAVGDVAVGDEVIVNTTAVDLGLGTGGWHVVLWNLTRREWEHHGRGHIMKLRYTGLQLDTGAAEEHQWADDQDGEGDQDTGGHGDHEADPTATGFADLDGVPVLIGGLHSQLGTAAAVIHRLDPSARVAYVMTDGAALPIVISDLVHRLTERDLVHTTITAGHAFGGRYEAVTVASGIHIAVTRATADVVVCTMGPGVVGTGTPLGTTAIEVGPIAAMVHSLGGQPVVIVRAGDADARSRHRGISHHTLTALRLCPVPLGVVVPPELAGRGLVPAPHTEVVVEPPDPVDALDHAGVAVTTMGRGPVDDPLAFRAVAAAASHAVGIAHRRRGARPAPPDGTVSPA